MIHHTDIFSFIKDQENAYKQPIPLSRNWDWSMNDHIETAYLYSHSQLRTGKNDYKPVKNIVRPILNLQHRTEDIEMKDVQIYVNDSSKYHLSFLVKKYHDDVFVIENDMETFLDELNVERIDYGAGLSKQLDKPRPEVVPLQSIAFCDQTDMLSGPIGLRHYFSPDQLLDMKSVGWGNPENGATRTLEETILLSREEKEKDGTFTKTPGRYIEVREVHGNMPKRFADPSYEGLDYETRIFIVVFYLPKDSKDEKGIILFTKPEPKSPFKLIKRDPVYGRALGFGGAEELFEPQVWVNYNMIRKQNMLDAAAVTILKSTDSTIAAKHPSGLKNLKNLEVLDIAPNTDISQVDTFPRNVALFDRSTEEWEIHAQRMGSANDTQLSDNPPSGTPFALQELVTNESQGLHNYRRGQYAKHLEEIYNDWIIPHIQRKITQGSKFLSELSLEEMDYVVEKLVANQTSKMMVEKTLNGELVSPEERESFEQEVRDNFKKKGTKHFIEILKGEFRRVPLAVKVTIAGKSKNLARQAQNYVNLFREIRSTDPQLFRIPAIANIFNQVIESSGLDPVDFASITEEQFASVLQQSQPQTQAQLPQLKAPQEVTA